MHDAVIGEPNMPKTKKATEDGTTPKPRRIGLELSDDVTQEVAAYCQDRSWLKESEVKDLIREEARAAAEAAVAGRVAEILTAKLR